MTDATAPVRPHVSGRGKMLPGVAAIAMFLLFMTTITSFQVIATPIVSVTTKYGILALSTILAAGIFGLLKMRRWGWAIVLAACTLMIAASAWAFHITHFARYMVSAAFMLVFFLYLVRPEVRERMI